MDNAEERRRNEQQDIEEYDEWKAEMRGLIRRPKPKRADGMAQLEKDMARAKIACDEIDRRNAERECPICGCEEPHSCVARI